MTLDKEKVLLEWESPERVYTKRSRVYFKNLFTLLAILAAVAVFFKEFLLAGTLASLGFLKWALGTTPPRNVKHFVTSMGIKTHGHEYTWDELKDFWFGEVGGRPVLHIDTKAIYPGRLYLLLDKVGRSEIMETLSNHLPFRHEVREDFAEKISAAVARKIPLE
jgi:hypothetical protein